MEQINDITNITPHHSTVSGASHQPCWAMNHILAIFAMKCDIHVTIITGCEDDPDAQCVPMKSKTDSTGRFQPQLSSA